VVAGQVLAVLGALVLVRVLTEHLNPAQYGQLALGLTSAGLVNQVIMGGVIGGIGRFYSIAAEKKDLGNYLHATNHLLAYATVAVSGIGILLMIGLLWLGYSQWMGLAAAALLFSLLSSYHSSLNGIQNAARQRHIVAFHGGMDAWLKILLALGIISWLGTSSTAVVIGYACSSILITVSQLIFLRRIVPPQQSPASNYKPWISQIWAYSWPFSTWGVFTWMQQVSDRWVLQFYSSTADVGQYAVLFQIGYAPIALFTGMAMSFLGPILWQRSGDATDSKRNANVHRLGWRLTYLGLAVTLSGFVIAFFLHDWLFGFLVAPEYRVSSYLLPWVVLAGGIFAAGQMLALKLMSDMKSASMISAKIITALMGVSFNIIGAVVAGVEGVVGALVAFSIVYLVWMVFLAAKTPDIN
jgi:O-antigen/teichoic acid export membrane protein